ncbi:MAG: hypothetical protein R3F17_14155 [Planctomycetota bacterium]
MLTGEPTGLLALGMLVDNSVVVIENITRFQAKGGRTQTSGSPPAPGTWAWRSRWRPSPRW